MAESKVARRYANSLLGLAQETKQTEQVYADMKLISDTVKNNRELALLMRNPIVAGDKKDAVMKAIFADKTSKITSEFITLMINKGREFYLEEIAKEYIVLHKAMIGVKTAEVTTVVPLDSQTREQILSMIRSKYGTQAELNEHINKNLIGGFILRIGDEQYDASVLRRLSTLGRELSSTAYTKQI